MPTLAQAISDLTTLRTLPTDAALHLLKANTKPVSEKEILNGTDEQHNTEEYARAVEFLRLRREEGRDEEYERLRGEVERLVSERVGGQGAGR